MIWLVNPQNGSWVLFTKSQNSLYQGSLYQGLGVLVVQRLERKVQFQGDFIGIQNKRVD